MIEWVALNLVDGLRPIHRAALLKAFGNPSDIFRRTEIELSTIPEIKPEIAYKITHFNIKEGEHEIRRSENAGIRVICPDSQDYPELLKLIPDPPLALYIKGRLNAQERAIALVGSRKATPYGLNVTAGLARELSSAGITIVSGLARGIDAAAHNAVVQASGRTIAVLGSGLDVIYPSEHKSLAERIAADGAIVSEFPLGTPPNRENFPIRNRIISGMSMAVVVVEASMKSGSLITARMASEQGRDVLAVPGSIFNESSQGCNQLIKDGAALVQSWQDVAAALKMDKLIAPSPAQEDAEVSSRNLTEPEKSIIALLSFEQPKHIDQLAGVTGIRSQDLLGALVNLELKNYISQMPGKHYIRLK